MQIFLTLGMYSQFSAYMNLCQGFCLLVLMPIFSWRLSLHDALLASVVVAVEAVSYMTTPLADDWLKFYIVQGIGAIGFCKYPLLKSTLSKVN
jgi:hypothetical protein